MTLDRRLPARLVSMMLVSCALWAQTPIVFHPPNGYPPCTGSGPLEMGDVDRDGRPDVTIGTGPPYNQVCVLRNTNYGDFAPGVVLSMGTGFSRHRLVDLNYDGFPDIVSAHFNPGTFRVWMNVGTGPGSIAFGPPSAPTSLGTVGVNDIASADLDGDGDVDLAFVAFSGTYPSYSMTASVFANDGTGSFSLISTFAVPGATALAAGDFDHDGDRDLAFGGPLGTGAFVEIRNNAGNGTFGGPIPLVAPSTTWISKLHAIDADSDGDVDLIAGSDGIWIYTNDGASGFTLSTVYGPLPGQLAGQWIDADFNCDSHRDYVFSSNVNGMMFLMTGTPTGPSGPVPLGYAGYSLAAADMDHDWQLDLVCYREFGVSTMLNNSNTPCYPRDGLVTSVNGSPFSKDDKFIYPGDTVAWKTDVAHAPWIRGKPATIFVNLPPDSSIVAYTPITGLLPVPNFEAVHALSVPAGTAFFTGDSLYLGTQSFGIDLGFGPLAMGDAAFTALVPPWLAVGDRIRMQAVYFDPHPNNWWIITATNPVRLDRGP